MSTVSSSTSLTDLRSYSSDSSIYATSDESDTDAMVENFISLLTAQLQYQDPLEPMENAEFTSQLAQFSMLNLQQETNTLLSEMVSTTDAMTDAVDYIGKTVKIEGDQVVTDDGYGEMSFELSAGANVSINIYNQDGEMLGAIDSQYFDAGEATVSFYDETLGDSVLSYQVVVEDEDSEVAVTQYERGVVDTVVNGDDGIELEVNGHAVTMDELLSVGV